MSQKLLLFDYNQLSREEILATLKEITVNLQKHFKNHVGFANATSPHEIFEVVTGLDPNTLSIYKREYWWNVIRKTMSKLRAAEDLFIIHRGQNWFVLQTKEECTQYKTILDRSIQGLKDSKIKADKWVENEGWRTCRIEIVLKGGLK